jgi:L-alanine-DL-glutamate epimerase-like enolase superfamily enzyme
MERIREAKARLYQVPAQREIGNALLTYKAFEFVFVHLSTEDGLEGVGWVYTVGVGGSSIKALLDDYLFRFVIDQNPRLGGKCTSMLSRVTLPVSGVLASLAIAAIDIAMWDLRAKIADLPLYQLLGGVNTRVPACASGIDLNYTLDDLLLEVEGWLSQGYRLIKVKVGRPSIDEDVERLNAVRKLAGKGIKVMVDANQALTSTDAGRRSRAFERFDIEWFEDPIPVTDSDGYRRLRETSPIPIAGGETLGSVDGFSQLIACKGLDVVRADVCRIGGITPWLKAAHLAEAHHLLVAPHYIEEFSIHLACAIPNIHSVEQVPTCSLASAGALRNPLTVQDGYFIPPEGPGHGFELDEHRLREFEV